MDRVSTGNEGLDTMLQGGLVSGRPYIVTGPSGSGKSILAMHFLLDGLRRGESCMLVALDEPPSEIKSNVATFGWNIDTLTALDATPDIKPHKKKNVIDVGTTLDVRDMEQVKDVRKSVQIRSMEVSIHSVQKMIKQSAKELREQRGRQYSRIVIDSMTALKRFTLGGEDPRILVQSFLRFLSEMEATTLIISNPLQDETLETEFLLSRGEILLHKWIDGTAVRRAVSIERMRGVNADDQLRPMTIGPRGITVYAGATVSAKGPLRRTIDRPFLENRVADEVSSRMDAVIEALEAVRKAHGDTAEADVALLRGVVALHRRRYQEALRHLVTAQSRLIEELRVIEVEKKAGGAQG